MQPRSRYAARKTPQKLNRKSHLGDDVGAHIRLVTVAALARGWDRSLGGREIWRKEGIGDTDREISRGFGGHDQMESSSHFRVLELQLGGRGRRRGMRGGTSGQVGGASGWW
jgi:hypothetical protein